MEIKEAVEILKKCKSIYMTPIQSKALDLIIEAFWNGYTLCKVDEAVEKMDDLIEIIYADDSGTYKHGHTNGVSGCIDIIKEACK